MGKQTSPHYTLFDTAVGVCAIAWTDNGICRVQLPDESLMRTVERLRDAGITAAQPKPPAWVKKAIDTLTRHLGGDLQDLSTLTLDLSGVPPFYRQVYEAARQLGPGETLSYGELARRMGAPQAARAVGQAMAKNPVPIVIPCHRVLASGGKAGGFSAPGGLETKAKLLRGEGVELARAAPAAKARGAVKIRGTAKTRVTMKPRGEAKAKPAAPRARTARAKPMTHKGLDEKLAALAAADKELGALIAKIGPFALQLSATASVFEALAESIIYQQLTGKAAATIHGRVKALAKPKLTPAAILALADEALRGAGLSRNKIAALRDLAEKTLDGTVPTLRALAALGDEEIIERLVQVRGIGRWSAEMLLIFRLGRLDVFPVTDYGVRKGFALTFGLKALPTPAEMHKRGERWRPYRSVASWYLWRALENPAGRA